MRPLNRFIATVVAVAVWAAAGYAVASGPQAYKAIAPAVPDVAAVCSRPLQN
jgi:hypothetical protein